MLNYRSVMEFTRSDHKPVSRAAFLPLSATISFELSEESAPRLTGMMAKYQVAAQFLLPASSVTQRIKDRSPYTVDPLWRVKQLAGLVLDRLVGSVWCLLMLAGFNRDLRCVPKGAALLSMTNGY